MKSKIFVTTVGKLFGNEQFADNVETNPIILSENNDIYPGLMVRPLPIPVRMDYAPAIGTAGYITGLVRGTPHVPIIVRKFTNEDGTTDYVLLSTENRIMQLLQFLNDKVSVVVDGAPLKWSEFNAEQSDAVYQIQIPVYEVEGTDMELYNYMKDPFIVPARFGSYNSLNNAIFYGTLLKELSSLMNEKSERASLWKEFTKNNSGFGYDYVYTALSFVSRDHVAHYLNEHKNDSAMPVYKYFNDVVDWAVKLFGIPRYAIHSDWGAFYEKYHETEYDPAYTSKKAQELFDNPFIENKFGVYEFILSGETNNKLLLFDI